MRSVDEILSHCSDELREQFQTLLEAAQAPDAPRRELTNQLRLWIDACCEATAPPHRISSKGPIIGSFWRKVRTRSAASEGGKARKQPKALKRPALRRRLVRQLPYPLGYKFGEFLWELDKFEQGVGSSNFAFLVASLHGLLLRFIATLLLAEYVGSHQAPDAHMNQSLAGLLKQPSDGSWKQMIDLLLRWHQERASRSRVGEEELSSPVAVAVKGMFAIKESRKAPSSAHLIEGLVAFRNQLLHGSHQHTEKEIASAASQVETLYGRLQFLGFWEWWICLPEGNARLAGDEFALADTPPPDAVLAHGREGHLVVYMPSPGRAVSLHPLLLHSSMSGDDLFFYNGWSDGQVSYISYRFARTLSSRQLGASSAGFFAFLRSMPAAGRPEEARFDFSGVSSFHRSFFVGREACFQAICSFMTDDSSDRPYGLITATAGMGKTALLALLYDRYQRSRQWPAGVWPLWHFCSTSGGRHHPALFLRSIIAQLDDILATPGDVDYPTSIDLLRQLFAERLALMRQRSQASGRLDDAKRRPGLPPVTRIVLIVDALDEALASTQGSLSIPALLPAAADLPGFFSVLISYRVDESGHNEQVERLLPAAEHNQFPIPGCSPLGGLSRVDVSAMLSHVVAGAVLPATEEAIWKTASQDDHRRDARGATFGPEAMFAKRSQSPSRADGLADPFVLRFLADGLKEGSIDPSRPETVPSSLHALFEQLWNRLPTEHHYFLHRLLGMLAVMPSSGYDSLFAEIFSAQAHSKGAETIFPDDVAERRQAINKLLVFSGDRYRIFHERFQLFVLHRFRPKERAFELHWPLYAYCISEQGRGSQYDLYNRLFHLQALADHQGLSGDERRRFRDLLWESLWDEAYFEDKFKYLNRIDALSADFLRSFQVFRPDVPGSDPDRKGEAGSSLDQGAWRQVARSFHLCKRSHAVVSHGLELSQEKIEPYALNGDTEQVMRILQWDGASYRRLFRILFAAVWMHESGEDATGLLSYLGTIGAPSLRPEEQRFARQMLKRAAAPKRLFALLDSWQTTGVA